MLEDRVKIYSEEIHGPIGEMATQPNGMVAIHLEASYWPDRIRDEKVGLQYMGHYHSFDNFRNSGSFEDLTLEPGGNGEDMESLVDLWGIWP